MGETKYLFDSVLYPTGGSITSLHSIFFISFSSGLRNEFPVVGLASGKGHLVYLSRLEIV